MSKGIHLSKNGAGPRGFFAVLAVFIATPIILALLTAFFAYRAENSSVAAESYSLITLLISGVLSGTVGGRMIGFKRAMLAALMTVLLMMIAGILLSSSAPGMGAFMNYLCYMLTALVGAYLGKRRERRRLKKHRH